MSTESAGTNRYAQNTHKLCFCQSVKKISNLGVCCLAIKCNHNLIRDEWRPLLCQRMFLSNMEGKEPQECLAGKRPRRLGRVNPTQYDKAVWNSLEILLKDRGRGGQGRTQCPAPSSCLPECVCDPGSVQVLSLTCCPGWVLALQTSLPSSFLLRCGYVSVCACKCASECVSVGSCLCL